MFVQLTKEHLGQKAGYRFDTDEAVAKTLIQAGVAEAIKDDPLAPIIAKSMESMLSGLTKSLNETIDATLKEFAVESKKSRKNAVPAIFGKGGEGDTKKTFGQFLLAVKARDEKALEAMGSRYCEWENVDQKAAMSTQTGTTGGYLVPQEHRDEIMDLSVEDAIVRPRATKIPMRARTVQVPALDVVTAPSAGDSAFLGGVVARWTEEATSVNETEPTFKQLDLTNYELSGYSKLSNTLLADEAVGLEKFLMQLFSKAIDWYEDYAFLRGNGVAKPLGIINWTGYVQVTRSAASAFALSDAASMLGRMLPGWKQKNTCWIIHPTVLTKLIQMTGNSGVGSDLCYIDNARETPKMMLFGIPIEVTEKVPALNTAGDVSLCNFEHYLLGDREQIEIAYSEHVAFLTNQSVWRFVSRVGGMPWLKDKVTLSDATNTLTPFVGLAAG